MIIKKLKLFTNQLEPLFEFYINTLSFPLIERHPDFFSFQCGHSTLVFEYGNRQSYYHYALHLPLVLFEEAYQFYKDKIQLLKDPETGLETIEHLHWNARALYFLDPAGNIGEFIAHQKYQRPSAYSTYSPKAIIGINEIGHPCEKVGENYSQVKEQLGLQHFSGDMERFGAVGDAEGLFIFVKAGKKKWFPTEIPARPFPWEARIQISNEDYEVNSNLFV